MTEPLITSNDPLLSELASAFGIATEFWDWQNRRTQVSDETLVAVLAALDVDASSADSARLALHDLQRRTWQRLLPPVTVLEQNHTGYVNVHVHAGAPAWVQARFEDGGVRDLHQIDNHSPDREFDGQWYGEATFVIPADLPLGYHRLWIKSGDREADSALIITPSWLGLPGSLRDRRVWGYATQFYSVRSKNSWGLGDFQDLADLAVWSKTQQNAGYLLANPVHASTPLVPLEPSPYLPSSRRYLNPIYIRIESIAEYGELSEKKKARIQEIKKQLLNHIGPDRLERDPVWIAKIKALRIVYSRGLSATRTMAFEDFRKKEGRPLLHFATWCALVTEFGPAWRQWPEQYQRPSSPEVAQFAANHEKMITFYCWLQWVVDTQMSQAQLAAKDVGMPIGIINDLAVGVSHDSAETWSFHDLFAEGVQVGAPPDAYNQQGQCWGQPPWRPDRLAELAYAPFRTMVAGLLRHSGGLRIDHVMGMFRLWWVPDGSNPQQGTYVRYHHDAMVGILALEAHRAGALIIGEDLGTVEPWVRDYLRRRGILGTSVLWFENDHDGHPLQPEHWREYCMASVTTHDLPPSAGYLGLEHVRLRAKLGLLTVGLDEELQHAKQEQQAVLAALKQRGLLVGDESDIEQIVLALHRYLAQTPAKVLCAALVDAVGDVRIQNQPGTYLEYPNWQIPLSDNTGTAIVLEDLFTSQRATRLAAVLNGWER